LRPNSKISVRNPRIKNHKIMYSGNTVIQRSYGQNSVSIFTWYHEILHTYIYIFNILAVMFNFVHRLHIVSSQSCNFNIFIWIIKVLKSISIFRGKKKLKQADKSLPEEKLIKTMIEKANLPNMTQVGPGIPFQMWLMRRKTHPIQRQQAWDMRQRPGTFLSSLMAAWHTITKVRARMDMERQVEWAYLLKMSLVVGSYRS